MSGSSPGLFSGMSAGLGMLALVIVLGTVLILAPIGAEYRYAVKRLGQSEGERTTIAGGYRYVCWATGTTMIAAAMVLLFRLQW
jgi:hypothetical protein